VFRFLLNNNSESVLKLFLGTVTAQLIPFLLTPVFSRLYTPEEFALLGILMVSANVMFEVYSLKYDKAIVVAPDTLQALQLVKISVISSLFFAVTSAVVFLFVNASFLNQIHPKAYLFSQIVPWITFFMSFLYITNFWLQRNNEVKKMVLLRMVQVIFVSVFSLCLGVFHINEGLTWGYFFGWAMAFVFSFIILRDNIKRMHFNSFSDLKHTMAAFSDFPLYAVFPSLAYVIAVSVPVYLINYHYGNENGGYFNMCRQLTMVPLSFISSSYMQVYLRTFSLQIQEGKGVKDLVKEIMIPQVVLGIVLMGSFFLFAERIFTFLLGEKWNMSSKMISVYIIPSVLQMMFTSVSVFFSASGTLKHEAFLKTSYALLMGVLFFFTSFSFEEFFKLFVVTESGFYFLSIFIVLFFVRKYDHKSK